MCNFYCIDQESFGALTSISYVFNTLQNVASQYFAFVHVGLTFFRENGRRFIALESRLMRGCTFSSRRGNKACHLCQKEKKIYCK